MKRNEERAELINEMKLQLPSLSVNEGIARAVVAAFCAQLDPASCELADIKCAVSEAVTNCIVHGYRDSLGTIYITAKLYSDGTVKVVIRDKGCGIEDINKAMEPMFTTSPGEERSGMGFTVMASFCDKIKVSSALGKGTTVILEKKLSYT